MIFNDNKYVYVLRECRRWLVVLKRFAYEGRWWIATSDDRAPLAAGRAQCHDAVSFSFTTASQYTYRVSHQTQLIISYTLTLRLNVKLEILVGFFFLWNWISSNSLLLLNELMSPEDKCTLVKRRGSSQIFLRFARRHMFAFSSAHR